MKKVLVRAYIEKNLGDDLFLYVLSRRYPHVRFYALAKKPYFIADNIVVKKYTIFHTLINKILSVITLGSLDINSLYAIGKDAVVMIGGSMFIEKKNEKIPRKVPIMSKPNFFIGCNFGPYNTKKYLNYHKKLFEKAKDVCFRDIKSYRQFSMIGKTVRYAPDIVFSLPIKKIPSNNKKSNNVVISVMDLSFKHHSINQEHYEKAILEAIKYYKKQNYNIKLMSFCKNEHDDQAIASIINKSNISQIGYYLYDGNIQEALNEINNSDIVIGTRYHANILGMVYGKTTIPLIYSDKMLNVLQDIGFVNNYVDLRNDNTDKQLIETIIRKNSSSFDISGARKESEGHFEVLDKILKNSKK